MQIRFLAFFLLLLWACGGNKPQKQASTDPIGNPKFAIQEDFHNFGAVEAGELVSFSFKFTNEGTGNLLIDSIHVDCGCLHVNYPQEPIKAGEKGYVEVLFNTAGEVGYTLKQIEIYSNTPEQLQRLAVTAQVNNKMINIYEK